MLRMVGFFALVLVVLQVLRHVPGIGALFRIPLLGFWGAAILVSVGLSWLANEGLRRRSLRNRLSSLGAVDTPHNQGKLGALLQSYGRTRRSLEPLARAVEGDPDVAEWPYRLGCAQIDQRRFGEAVASLERAAAIDEEHAYGKVLLRLSEALINEGRSGEALDVLARFERNHGPSPEQAYRQGRALAAAGRKDEARASYARVGELAASAARFQKREARGWALRAFFAQLF